MRSFKSTTQPSHQKPNRYRSVKYKIAREHSVCTSMKASSSKSKPIINLPPTNKYQYSRKRKNISQFVGKNMTQSYFSNCALNNQSTHQMRRTSYMQSYDFLVKMEKNGQNKKEKGRENAQQQLNQSEKELSQKFLRVQLPVLNELQSQFTVLDNINLPIQYINEQIERIKQEMKVQEENVGKIKKKMDEIEITALKKIQQTQKHGKKEFQRLRALLKTNRVIQQQSNLKIKRSFSQCQNYLPQFGQKLEQSKQRCLKLQQTIFKAHPFQLKQSEEFEILTGDYF